MNNEQIDLTTLFIDAIDNCSKKSECGGQRYNFGVYYTPRF